MSARRPSSKLAKGDSPFLDAVHETVDLGHERLEIAFQEKELVQFAGLDRLTRETPHLVWFAIIRDEHAGASHQLDPLVIAVDGGPRVIDVALFARGGPKDKH